MGEPLKNLFNTKLINDLSNGIRAVYPLFDSPSFYGEIINNDWEKRELKDRMNHISRTLGRFLPEDYSESVSILKKVSSQFEGLGHMVFPGFVECFGIDEFDVSVDALETFTKYSSSEFAIRPFIKKYPGEMIEIMTQWTTSDNEHVRRLASEGCRPRLPWAMALPDFKKDPSPILPILEKLKNDESEYVRRSVANNLNDIAKDHPAVVLDLAGKWMGENKNTDKLVKHACRTLLKQGNIDVLILFGYSDPHHIFLRDFVVQDSVEMEKSLPFSFSIVTDVEKLGMLRLEYAVDYMKKNGKQARKVFKIHESDYPDKERDFRRTISFKSITTRKYYSGEHGLAIIINGVEMARKKFILK